MEARVEYLTGFGSHFETEALPGTLPVGRNSPQRPAHGLYAEQLSGSAFTAPRHENLRSWLYRIRPSVVQGDFAPVPLPHWQSGPFPGGQTPNALRWRPFPSTSGRDFVESVFTVAGNGAVDGRSGFAVHVYAFDRSMERRFFYDADGELIFVPQDGELEIRTEFGVLQVEPLQIAVVPRGVKFQVRTSAKRASGYLGENYGAPFRLPGLGPIGANGLANPRDFQYPTAAFEERSGDFELWAKFDGAFFRAPIGHSPLDVVGWHGNYAPYRYDLRRFNAIGTISFDHPDPSIFTVLTSPTDQPGVANCDFVIFPPRWLVGEDTFRPPYYHRNCMSEFMGLIRGVYDAKEEGFVPGGSSLHNCMTPHGPDADAFRKASEAKLVPQFLGETMAFMFESVRVFRPTKQSLESPSLDEKYRDCWTGLDAHFRR